VRGSEEKKGAKSPIDGGGTALGRLEGPEISDDDHEPERLTPPREGEDEGAARLRPWTRADWGVYVNRMRGGECGTDPPLSKPKAGVEGAPPLFPPLLQRNHEKRPFCGVKRHEENFLATNLKINLKRNQGNRFGLTPTRFWLEFNQIQTTQVLFP